jgi:hypothetical protein
MMSQMSQAEFAYHVVSKGKHYVLLVGLCVWGPVFFVGTAAFTYFRRLHDPHPLPGAALAYFLLAAFVLSEGLGLIVSFFSWYRYQRLAKGWKA